MVRLALLVVAPTLAGCLGGGARSDPHVLTLEGAPTRARVGEVIHVTYSVSGPAARAQYNVVHFDAVSHPRDIGIRAEDYRNFVYEPGKQTNVPVPANFTVPLSFDKPGTYYYRAHVVVGTQDLWSREVAVNVTAS